MMAELILTMLLIHLWRITRWYVIPKFLLHPADVQGLFGKSIFQVVYYEVYKCFSLYGGVLCEFDSKSFKFSRPLYHPP